MVTSGLSSIHRRHKTLCSTQTWWCLPACGALLCLSVLALSKTWGSTAQPKQPEHTNKDTVQTFSDAKHNSEGLVGPLDLDQCKHLPQLRVCSHQVNGATTTWGRMAALRELFEMGVRCFDIDIVITADKQLLVTHPKALQDVLQEQTLLQSERNLHSYSLAELRQLGANHTAFPSAAEFLEEFSRLVREIQHDWQGWDAHRMPFIFLELKGAAYNTETIDWLWAEALEAGMVDYLALYVLDDQQPVSLAQQTNWQGQLIRGYRDLSDSQSGYDTKGQALQASAMVGPSIDLPADFFSQLEQTRKPVFAWVVDSPQQMRSALSKRIHGVISNDPLFLKLVLKSWWKKCRSL